MSLQKLVTKVTGRAADPEQDRVKAIGKFLRANVPAKERNVNERRARYSSGRKILDVLMASKYSLEANPDSNEAFITNRRAAQRFCETHLIPDYIHRGFFEEKESKRKDGSVKKKKILLPYAENRQYMIDGPEPYIWTFEPTGVSSWILGAGLILGVGLCVMLPVWPSEMRVAVDYGAKGLLVLLGVYFALLLVRVLAFFAVWVATGGVYHFWIFPNLNDDKLGVIDSFKPLYTNQNYYKEQEEKKQKDKKKKKKDSDNEEEDAEVKRGDSKGNSTTEETAGADDTKGKSAGGFDDDNLPDLADLEAPSTDDDEAEQDDKGSQE